MMFFNTKKPQFTSKTKFGLPILITFLLMLSIMQITNAQVISSGENGVIPIRDVPPNAEPGKCYAKCVLKDDAGEYSFADWKEVVCPKSLTSKVVKKVKKKLRKNGYSIPKSEKNFGDKTKNALTQFQKAKELPVGQLDFETIAALGIKVRS